MARKDGTANSAVRRIRDVGLTSGRLDPAIIAEVLGAEEAGPALGLNRSSRPFKMHGIPT
jgi:hypothetical protein